MAKDRKIGQIIYNIEDFAGTGGLISSKAENSLYQTVQSYDNSNYENERIKIYLDDSTEGLNILANLGIQQVYKLGIQAPPGTVFYLRRPGVIDANSIIVGRTGVYEFEDDNIQIDFLAFKRPTQYVLDPVKTQQYINEGIKQMEEAKLKFDTEYNKIKLAKNTSGGSMTNEKFWEDYDALYEDYSEEYYTARTKYLQGQAGIYINDLNYNNDLYNVIIDFVY